MHLINSKKELRDSPEIREPNAESLRANPEHYATRLREELPVGEFITEVRRLDYLNHMSDLCSALLIVTSENRTYVIVNEIGPDALEEMACAGRSLAQVLNARFAQGEPEHWPCTRVPFIARLFGYAG